MNGKKTGKLILGLLALAALAVCLGLLVYGVRQTIDGPASAEAVPAGPAGASIAVSATMEPTPTAVPTPTPVPTPLPEFEPQRRGTRVITDTAIMVHGEEQDSYQADQAHTIDFGAPEDYAQVEGIVTFRGNNFRNSSVHGVAALDAAAFGDHWRVRSGGLNSSGTYWGGSGWTGQPLAVKWPESTKKIMDMEDWAKEKEDLVEVIYATLGGEVYFLDLETGDATRDELHLGFPFKGAGSLDPRGYPLMYLGGGVPGPGGQTPRIMVVSLIDGEVLYTTGNGDSFAPRGWTAWDSAPLVDAETDQLIYPGENGVLYIIDLNTQYDEAAGTISVDPEVVKFTYTSETAEKYLYGMEDSAIVWRDHIFIADNGGDFLCIDLNTLQIEWRFDCLDDTNCTGVMELDETGHPYIYLSTSFHNGWRSYTTAEIPVWKIDAVTGEEVWHQSYECHSLDDLSGGVQGSLSLGTGPLEGILYVSVARYPDLGNGRVVALDTDTGEELWYHKSSSYSWSTPVCFYDTDGNGYVLYTSAISSKMYLLDGLTGEVYDTYDFGCTVEATPIVWDNMLVIGTRDQEIYGIELK